MINIYATKELIEVYMKVLFVFGTRPEAIKMCPVILEAKKHSNIEVVICLTGQHKEMLSTVMEIFKIKEDYNLNIMRENQDLFTITGDCLQGLNEVYKIEKPDMVLVHGDTTSAFVAALAGFYKKIDVGHVEAGLRTYNMCSPFPEEFNRRTIDSIARICFAPTESAKKNLEKEGICRDKIFVTGNTAIDALRSTVNCGYVDDNLTWIDGDKMILLTMHRRENLGEPMYNVFNACKRLLRKYADLKIIFPVHKNPNIRSIVNEVFMEEERIRVIEPLNVLQFHNYMNRSYFIMTDSGGVQEEAPSLGKPVLVLRDETERPEGVESGTLRLIGTKEDVVFDEACNLLEDKSRYEQMSNSNNPYGDGYASKYIVDALLKCLMEGKND